MRLVDFFKINKPENKNIYYFLLLSLILVFIDQVTKFTIKGFDFAGIFHKGMALGESFSVIGNFLRITYIENEGMAFGISFGTGKVLLSLFRIIASLLLIIYLLKLSKANTGIKLGVSLILAGAVGNLVDSMFYGVIYNEAPLFYGRVVDFIQIDIPDVRLGNFTYTSWPIFNVADSCVTCGVILLLIFHKYIPTFDELSNRTNTEISTPESLKIDELPIIDEKE